MVPQDYKIAVKWFTRAAEQGDAWKGDDLACFGALDRPGEWAVLTQGQVSARAVAVVQVRCENAA